MKIGIISDTHGLLREEVLDILRTCDVILHGGDVNRQEILDRLTEIAPLYTVRGNNDKDWAEHLPLSIDIKLSGLHICMAHKKRDLPSDLSAFGLVVYGHSHKYAEDYLGDLVLLNPGSCGPRRFRQPITMATVEYPENTDQSVDIRGKDLKVTRIDIPHPLEGQMQNKTVQDNVDLLQQIQAVMADTDKGLSVSKISSRRRLDADLITQIVRLYLTHPGVTAEGILNKMQ